MLLLISILLGVCDINCEPQQPVASANVEFNDLQNKAREFVKQAEAELQEAAIESTFNEWNYESNITDETKAIATVSKEKFSKIEKKIGREAQKFNINQIKDYDVSRKLKLMRNLGTSALPNDKLKAFIKLVSDMGEIYSKAKVLDYETKSQEFSLEPELTEIMRNSRDPKKLEYYWTQWRDASGKKMVNKYKTYVDLYNEAAELNGFSDAARMKVDPYESATFIEEMEETWFGLKPLYEQLHAYVRHKLNKHYGSDIVSDTDALPAHLLGNMWAQSWNNIDDIVRPYPNKPSLNVTGEMVRQGWTQRKMFEKADDFFQSIGLTAVPEEFWSGSIIEKPKGRELTCHASAWDFYNGKDFRIKQCTRVNQEDFVTVNHEMGHIQYFLQYKHLSYLYRQGANPGFHEGVADILSLSVGTATYFQRLGLLSPDVDVSDEETNINILLSMALERIAFLPFGYLVDKFRWDVYSGKTSKENMNCHWWKLRHDIQGIKPPNTRNTDQFDAGAKYHVASDVGYVRYFTAFIYEFQFYRELCLASGKYVKGDPAKPLHQCNFYGSYEAGDKLREMIKLGASKPWKEVMRVMTGEPKMDTNAIRAYFEPLEAWLKAENQRNGITVGWGKAKIGQLCSKSKSGNVKDRVLEGHNAGSGSVILTTSSFYLLLSYYILFIRY